MRPANVGGRPHATSILIVRTMFALVTSTEAVRRIEQFYGTVGDAVSEDLHRRVGSVGGDGTGSRLHRP